jgi:hypothetical protein
MGSAPHTNPELWGKTFRKNSEVLSRRIAGEMFLVPVKGKLANMQNIFTLNRVAEHIWHELEDHSLDSICDSVMDTFDVEREQAKTDIREFITELLEAELIQEKA